jgi:hypothetical protein
MVIVSGNKEMKLQVRQKESRRRKKGRDGRNEEKYHRKRHLYGKSETSVVNTKF